MASFNKLLFDSDSDDEYFMGFETEEINNNDTTYNIFVNKNINCTDVYFSHVEMYYRY